MDESRAKGLCFNYDNKYSKGYKCTKKKLFYIEEEEEEEEEEVKPTQENEETTPTIYCHALASTGATQTLNIEGHVKKKKVIGEKIQVQTMFPELDEERKIILEHEAVIKRGIKQLINRETTKYLIKWRNWPVEDVKPTQEKQLQPYIVMHWKALAPLKL